MPYMCIYIHIHMYVYIYIYIHTHTHTHTHTHICQKLVIWPPLAIIKPKKAEHITKYKIRPLYRVGPLNMSTRENEYWVGN